MDSDKWPKLSKFLDPDWRHRQLKRTPAREQPNTRTITAPAAGEGPAGPSGSLIQRCKLRSRHLGRAHNPANSNVPGAIDGWAATDKRRLGRVLRTQPAVASCG